MRGFMLEVIRIICLYAVVGGILFAILHFGYKLFGINQYEGFLFTAVGLMLFIRYRNKWQFSGWYKGEGKKSLSRRTTSILMTATGILLVVPVAAEFL